ncbi:LytTR family transcriptional regulator DNA-binding domain-containing protein [Phenylobacterium sp. LjRoot225]|uniref:LytTR family DNA-binding domain-containing protein n=1 Tax=Phenylobacterium sp. LjRoot225 TaxID=3342285 RepID=UPI003ECD090D
MEDHYVRVHTAGGSRLVLATFAQAIAAMGRTPGLRVHRSWWVADKAVDRAEAEGRNLRLILTNGVSAPVARSSVAAVREAGWLQRPGRARCETERPTASAALSS